MPMLNIVSTLQPYSFVATNARELGKTSDETTDKAKAMQKTITYSFLTESSLAAKNKQE